uniref:Uncharacterized protein n=1 Tax=Physcomitrium patens TaxID=3218 RepID=A0A2K1IK53_PHYPA|nr:hypothetical protein PHYPA_028345 [Physcomitrium patens]
MKPQTQSALEPSQPLSGFSVCGKNKLRGKNRKEHQKVKQKLKVIKIQKRKKKSRNKKRRLKDETMQTSLKPIQPRGSMVLKLFRYGGYK